ncbi:glycine cleavage system T protein [Pyrolobus fumarii 1A]|uniref:aminomethyltransferase n=1 Tax=Pyrolobus fumarii (strain DSM 11204 / 1A) TaxID=694429 RepID=G0EEP5_PYRF1|nr:glycine cleavage system aminomethyltransferase GcvT [Pyrolobus fumarii]AEM38867.1 glycine cleavage system T protein [Pyrolobus fumarii 1A]
MPLRSPLYQLHRELGAVFTVFAGWEHPVDYGSVVEEHLAVRKRVGVFDLSHLGRIIISGSDAKELLEKLVPRRLAGKPGVVDGPTAFLDEKGGFIDDVLLYPLSNGEWMIVANAASREKDIAWLQQWARRLGLDVEIRDETFSMALVAVQGPESLRVLGRVGLDVATLESLKRMEFVENLDSPFGKLRVVSRSGWTGEDGFEIYADPDTSAKLFRALVEAGARPCGLGARDSLRMEVGFPLIGDELGPDVTPIEARYWLVLDMGKVASGECVGCDAVWRRLLEGVSRVRLGVKLGKGVRLVPRKGDKILVGDVEIGRVTSGAYSPILERGIGQAYIDAGHALPGLEVVVERGKKRVKAKLVDFPLIKLGGRG